MKTTIARTLVRLLPLGVIVAGLSVPCADAQTLGDIAKAEAARRAAVKTRGQAITDKDIKPAAPMAQPSKPPVDAASQADPAAGPPATAGAEGGEGLPEPMKPREKRDEAYWRKRFAETRGAVERANGDAAAVQARIQAIDMEMQDTKLPAGRRSELNAERTAAQTALKRFKQDAADLAGELANLERRAQDAKIDPAWTR
jgi:hypothetical protein